MRFSFFKLPKAKAFDYKPMYYDPVKEAAKNAEKLKEANKDANEADVIKARLKSEMDEKWAIGRHKGNHARGFINSKNILIYIAIALLLLYFIFG